MFNPDDKWSSDMKNSSVNRTDNKDNSDRRIARRENGAPREKFKKVMDSTTKTDAEPEKEQVSEVNEKKILPKPFDELSGEVESPVSTPKKEKKQVVQASPAEDIFNIASSHPSKKTASINALAPQPLTPEKEIKPAEISLLDQEKIKKTAPIHTSLETGKPIPIEELPSKERIEKATNFMAIDAAPAPIIAPIAPSIQVEHISPAVRIQNLKALAQAMLKSMVTLNRNGETETVVTLHNSTLFEGATIRLTQTTSAPKEFNLTFGNLSTDALRLMQSKQTQEGLQHALAERGYTVHMMTMRHDADEGILSYRDQEREPSEGDRRNQQQQEDES